MNANLENMTAEEVQDLVEMLGEDWRLTEARLTRALAQLDQDYQCPRSGHYADEYLYDMEEEEESWQEF